MYTHTKRVYLITKYYYYSVHRYITPPLPPREDRPELQQISRSGARTRSRRE